MVDEFKLCNSPRHHYVHEVNGHSGDVDYKCMFYIACWYIFDDVAPEQRGPDCATDLSSIVSSLG